MAQTGFTPIQLYSSPTSGHVPTTANLTTGELALNSADLKLYTLNAAGNSVVTLVGTLGNQNANSVSITGGTVNGTSIGATTASTGAFTTLSASGVITSTVSTGTAPFTVASTTPVSNLSIGGSAPAGSLTGTTLASNVVSSSLTSVGTISTGVWNGTVIGATYGGTGVNNGSNTLTLAGNVSHAGAFTQTFTATANTSITLPTTGTLATLAGTETFTNKTLTNPTLSVATTISETRGAYTTYSSSVPITLAGNGITYFIAVWGSLNNSGTYGTSSVLLLVNTAYGYPYTVYGPAITTITTINNVQTGTGPTFSFSASVNGVVNLTMTGVGTKQYGYSVQAMAVGGAY
jgi:hypothetical protein